MNISTFSISDIIYFLENYVLTGVFLIAPLFQIYRTIKQQNSHGLSFGPWIALLSAGIIFLYLDTYYTFDYSSKSILQKIFEFKVLLPLFFIIENIVMICLISKYKKQTPAKKLL